jgi:hypothetical protein
MTAFPYAASAAITALAIAALASVSSAHAMSVPKHAVANSAPSALVKVHHDSWDDEWGYRHYYHRHYYRDEVVDAPFTHVETGRHVIVDAPFAHVYVGPHGRHIVAPFVDLWVPR